VHDIDDEHGAAAKVAKLPVLGETRQGISVTAVTF